MAASFDPLLLRPVPALVCSLVVLVALSGLAVALETFGGLSLATSPPWVRAAAWVFLPGFLIDVLVSETLHHGPPRLHDWVIMVTVSWLVWNTLALGALVAFEARRLRLE